MHNKTYKEIIYLAESYKEIEDKYEGHKSFYNSAKHELEKYCTVESLDVYDIWLRDFFPLQNPHTKELFTYNYDPMYDYEESSADYAECREYVRNRFRQATELDIWMDGGNLIHNESFGIFLDTNATNIGEKSKVLEEALGIKTIALPYRLDVPEDDPTGHVDGVMQFLGEDILFITEPYDPKDQGEKEEIENWKMIITKATDGKLTIVDLPNAWAECKPADANDDLESAKGVYVNFLETRDFVFVPKYGVPKDKLAYKAIKKHAGKKEVFQIDCTEISKHGGSLHCLTSTLLSKIWEHPIKDKKRFPNYYPIVEDGKSKILILGSFPSNDWKYGGFYYGSRYNYFWHLIVKILHEKYKDGSFTSFSQIGTGSEIDCQVKYMTPSEKANLLYDNNIALWDIVDKCTSYTGDWPSDDKYIAHPVLNDVSGFIDKHKSINVVLLTGKSSKLKKELSKEIRLKHPYLTVRLLPSPTGRVLSNSRYDYLKEWCEALNFQGMMPEENLE